MHSSLVATREGLPLGLAAIKFWNRDKFHGANALKRRVNPTRVPIEEKESIRWLENLEQSTQLANPDRCVHIGDRESDIYELFCLAEEQNTHFLVRTCVDRLAGDGKHTVAEEMKREPIRGRISVEVLDRSERQSTAGLKCNCVRMTVHPPIDKQKRVSAAVLTVIHAWERGKPEEAKADLTGSS